MKAKKRDYNVHIASTELFKKGAWTQSDAKVTSKERKITKNDAEKRGSMYYPPNRRVSNEKEQSRVRVSICCGKTGRS